MNISEEHQEVLVRVIDWVKPLEINEFVSHLLWEVVEGIRREPPFWWPAMPASVFEDLERLRDEARCWFLWDYDAGTWAIRSLEEWLAHLRECSTFDAIERAKGGAA